MMNRASLLVRLARASSTKVTVPSSSSLSLSAASPSQRTRCSSTNTKAKAKTNVTPAAADRRLAGRRRFYKNVGIASTSPPGEKQQPDDATSSKTTPAAAGAADVESPISAGVDGTQSATGVNITVPDSSRWSSLLNHYDESVESMEWHTVTLDGRALRTPLGLPLTLPSIALALAVASEWDAQKTYLKPAQMPLMTLCCTAIDQVASDPSAHQTDVLRYLRNDTSCYWADPTEDRVLNRRQSKAWDGLHTTLATNLLGLPDDLGPAHAVGGGEALLLSRKSKGNPMSGLPHPPLLMAKAEEWVNSLDAWSLTALYSACAESKSFFIGAALIHEANKKANNGGRGGEGAAKASDNAYYASVKDGKWAAGAARIEEEFNIENWGLVEGGHDYDRLNCSIQMHAASFLAQTVASSGSVAAGHAD